MTSRQYQPTPQDNERFIDDMLAIEEGRWVCHEEIKDVYDDWIIANLGRTKGSSSGQRTTLHSQILRRGGVRPGVLGLSDYTDGRRQRLHFQGVGPIDQTGTLFSLRS